METSGKGIDAYLKRSKRQGAQNITNTSTHSKKDINYLFLSHDAPI